ncbi:GLPGLI family protein [candidate division KSB1 bacterium]|nr:GLPGLI family protein [candidate division KSB1 bacterium]RQW04970.1 MAG: GLPGLI family protein [candidate division KSB1 bacterium]
MRCSFFCLFKIILFVLQVIYLPAQEISSGTVTYRATTRYDFQSLFATWVDEHRDWVDSIPTESLGTVTLSFGDQKALYNARCDEQVLPKQLRDAQAKAVNMQAPAAELKKLYLDLDKNQLIRQVEFMGRLFHISDEMKTKPWKLTNKTTKILDYTCMSAELKQEKSVVSYFTSEIPLPIGPDEYFGLPGLVLAVEVDGATAFLATAIDLTVPDTSEIAEPKQGKKVSQEKFEQIVRDKIKEYNETRYEGKKSK